MKAGGIGDLSGAAQRLRAFARPVTVLVCLFGSVSACRDYAPDDHGNRATRWQVADTIGIRIPADYEPLVGVVVERTIEGLREPSALEEGFSSVRALAVAPNGAIYVFDGGAQSIRVYSPDGEYEQTIGREGGGPGEYRWVSAMVILADDRLLVSDPWGGRMLIYNADGRVVTQFPRPPEWAPRAQYSAWADTAGHLYAALSDSYSYSSQHRARNPAFVEFADDGTVTDALYVPDRIFAACPTRQEPRFQSGYLDDIREPYVLKPKWGLGPGGELIVGCPDQYRFDVLRRDGTVLRVERTNWTPVPVSSSELETRQRGWTIQMRLSGRDPAYSWVGAEMQQRKPAYGYFLADPAGRIWVWLPQPSVEVSIERPVPSGAPRTRWKEPSGPVFDVYDSDGTPLGRVRLPASVPFEPNPRTVDPVVRGDTLWAVTVDSLGVESVTRFRLTFPSPTDGS